MTEHVLICGSRTWTDAAAIRRVIDALPVGTTIIHGGAGGADSLAGATARARGLSVQVYPADWQRYGRRAGPIRNAEMIRLGEPDRVIAFRATGASPGTDDMIRQAKVAGLPVEVIEDAAHSAARSRATEDR